MTLAIYVAVSVLLNGALTWRTLASFKGTTHATIAGTTYAFLAMITGYLTAVTPLDIITKSVITLLTATFGIWGGKMIEKKFAPLRVFAYQITTVHWNDSVVLREMLADFPNISYNTIQTTNGEQFNVYEKSKAPLFTKELKELQLNYVRVA